MKTILIFSLVVATAVGDVHELHNAYHYDKPITSYGVPSYTVDNKYNTGFLTSKLFSGGATSGNTGPSGGFTSNGVGHGAGLSSSTSGQSSTFGGSTSHNGNTYNTGYTVTGSNGQSINSGITSSSSTGGFQQFGGHQANQYQTGYQTTGQQSNLNYHSSNQPGNYQQHYNFVQSGPPQIFKHYYVHVAPEEPEEVRPQKPIVLPPKQKHYNIIFVKTPTPAASASHVIPIQQENEEKTIVYVLVQKPEEINDVVLPQFTPKPPSKPEVYFIKYNGKENTHGVINNIVNDYQNHDSVTFNGIGVSSDELSGKNVIIHDKPVLSDKYETSNNFVSSTESNNLGSGTFGASNVDISSIGSNEVVSSTPEYSGSTGGSLFSLTSGLGGFETGNEVKIGSSHAGPVVTESTGSSGGQFGTTSGKFSFSTSGKGDSSTGILGGSNNYQSVQIETSSVGSTSQGVDGIGLGSIQTSSVGSTSQGTDGIRLGSIQTSSVRPIESSSVGSSSTLNAIVTGNDIGSSTASSLGNNLNSISTSLSVPFETYGPPNFKP